MLEEPMQLVSEENIQLPVVSLGRNPRKAPSFTDEEIWHFAGDFLTVQLTSSSLLIHWFIERVFYCIE